MALKPYITYTEYLALEEKSLTKHEWLDGVIDDMSGGTPDHAGLAVAVSSALTQQLMGKRCRVFSSDLKIRVLATNLGTYPDISVVCGRLERDPDSNTAVTNPTVPMIAERSSLTIDGSRPCANTCSWGRRRR
jgi:Uma2 family endonuclease